MSNNFCINYLLALSIFGVFFFAVLLGLEYSGNEYLKHHYPSKEGALVRRKVLGYTFLINIMVSICLGVYSYASSMQKNDKNDESESERIWKFSKKMREEREKSIN